MSKQITYGDESRQAILRGVNSLANAVKVTLGPRGRNVILGTSYGSPTITKDGATVAKEIELKNPLENLGAQMVREVASKTADVVGRRHDDGHRAGAGDLSRRGEEPRGRRQSDGREAGDRRRRRRHRGVAQRAIAAGERRHDCPGRHHLGQPR